MKNNIRLVEPSVDLKRNIYPSTMNGNVQAKK